MSTTSPQGQRVHANGIDIHYLDQGEGEPLVLLHGGMVSTNLIWAGVPVAYASSMDKLAEHFRVIAPDTRGCGRTVHPGGPVSFDLLADDVAAMIAALGLERPLIAGFSEGAITATVLGIRHPAAVRAIVQLLRLTGSRPSELLSIRPCDLDRSGETWAFTLPDHKTAWKGKSRVVHFGPEAQGVLAPWLEGVGPDEFVFSPKRSLSFSMTCSHS